MEDFDVFTNEINYSKPAYAKMVQTFAKDMPQTPNTDNYQSSRKLQAEEHFANNADLECTFHLSESVSASIRTMAMYRDDSIKNTTDKLYKIESYIEPVQKIAEVYKKKSKCKDDSNLPLLDSKSLTQLLKKSIKPVEEPLHKRYLKFSHHNNVGNFLKILKELPKEWTVVQLTAPYNPNENMKQWVDYRTEIGSIYLSVLTNDYLEDHPPFTVNIPANVCKEGERPLFNELYSVLEENFKTIENAQLLNNKRLIQNYWSKREDIDLRMKSVIMIMDREWLGGWSSLLTGRLVDAALRDKVREFVDACIEDWGFIRLTKKQKILLYNLLECCQSLSSTQVKIGLRKILTQHGNTDDFRPVLPGDCSACSPEFGVLDELCLKCLSRCFEAVHKITLVEAIKAFSHIVRQMRENSEWEVLKKAKRHPVILIVDEMLDTFPWESLPLINTHPVSRMENIHFLYHLYKEHESSIEGGLFLTTAKNGRYVINPEKNLERMERRMTSFVSYWCGGWRGAVGAPPAPEDFVDYLREADVFLYCGHGNGCQVTSSARTDHVARSRTAAVLSGCGSARVQHAAARAPPAAAHHRYRLLASPMVVGMLWEVTDLEVDKVVSALLALAVPSRAAPPWERVGKAQWSQGLLDTSAEAKAQHTPERDLLTAVARARRSTSYVMIASSVVARGLPVRIVDQ